MPLIIFAGVIIAAVGVAAYKRMTADDQRAFLKKIGL